MTDLIATPHGTLFDFEPQAVAALIRPTDPAQVTVFDAIAEAETDQAAAPADLLAAVREHFDSIWKGATAGFSREKIAEQLAEHESLLEGLEGGTVAPATIVGRHVRKPKTAAREYLHRCIAEGRRDLAAEGRTNTVNIANVRFRMCEQYGWDSDVAAHRVNVVTDRVHISNTLWSLTCACGDSEYGYSRVSERSARDVERHMAGVHVLGRAAR